MERTINEKNAWKHIILGVFTMTILIGAYGYSVSINNILSVSIVLSMLMFNMIFLFYNFYSLGWEYKKISMEDE